MQVASRNGFTLIEVLVALVIVAVGLLGFASLQMSGMQRIEQSRAGRSGTTALRNLSERISAMPVAARAHLFDFDNLATGSAPQAPDCTDATQNCTDSQLARFELKRWYDEVQGSLASPRFNVTSALTSEGTTRVAISLIWDAALTGSAASSCTADSDGHFLANSYICRNLELLLP